MEKEVLLSVNNLNIFYHAERGQVQAVKNVSFEIHKGEFFGLAGESGCGKSTIAFSVLQLLKKTAQISGGEIDFYGKNILQLSGEEMRTFRWAKTSMVLQSAMNNLNPVITIGSQMADAIMAHEKVSKKEAYKRCCELLNLVNIDTERMNAYPHELSGGMRQRVVIAMALALKPELVIFDEPTTALDVVVQYNIIRKIRSLKEKMGFSVLFITHDLPLMLEICDRIAIMYAGNIVEMACVEQIKNDAAHPYTRGLLKAFPSLVGERKELKGIGGSVPDLITPPPGCLFYERCQERKKFCQEKVPVLQNIEEAHLCACHNLNNYDIGS